MFWIVVKQNGLWAEFSERCEKEELSKSAGARHAVTTSIASYPALLYHRAGRLSMGKYYIELEVGSQSLGVGRRTRWKMKAVDDGR